MFFKKVVLKNCAIFTRKHMCWSLFLINLQAWKSATLLKRNSSTGVSLQIQRNSSEQVFSKTSPVAASADSTQNSELGTGNLSCQLSVVVDQFIFYRKANAVIRALLQMPYSVYQYVLLEMPYLEQYLYTKPDTPIRGREFRLGNAVIWSRAFGVESAAIQNIVRRKICTMYRTIRSEV